MTDTRKFYFVTKNSKDCACGPVCRCGSNCQCKEKACAPGCNCASR